MVAPRPNTARGRACQGIDQRQEVRYHSIFPSRNSFIAAGRDRNWLEFLAVLDATLPTTPSADAVNSETKDKISRTREFFSEVEKEDGLKDRSATLAILELEKRVSTHGLVTGWRRQFYLLQTTS